jgi:hypothetical protein
LFIIKAGQKQSNGALMTETQGVRVEIPPAVFKDGKPPMEWVDKLFNCMELFYGTRWLSQFREKTPIQFYKQMWQSALTGLTYDEIRNTLVLLKRTAQNPASSPPNQLDFFFFARGIKKPYVKERDRTTVEGSCNPEITRRALDEINATLRFRKPLDFVSMPVAVGLHGGATFHVEPFDGYAEA